MNFGADGCILDALFYQELFGDDKENSDDELEDPLDGLCFPTIGNVSSYHTHADRINSVFWQKYIAPADCPGSVLRDPDTREASVFRRRFRVPYDLFEFLVADIKRVNKLKDVSVSSAGTPRVDLRIFILGLLHVITSGCPFDIIEELTYVAKETHRRFFQEMFCRWNDLESKEYIKFSTDAVAMNCVARQYKECGLAGCAASIDHVHVVWDRCPASTQSLCENGKEKAPTLAVQVAGYHMSNVSLFFWGTTNDKTITRIDRLFDLAQ